MTSGYATLSRVSVRNTSHITSHGGSLFLEEKEVLFRHFMMIKLPCGYTVEVINHRLILTLYSLLAGLVDDRTDPI